MERVETPGSLAAYLSPEQFVNDPMRKESLGRAKRFGEIQGWYVRLIDPDPEIKPDLQIIQSWPMDRIPNDKKAIHDIDADTARREVLLRDMFDLRSDQYFLNAIIKGAGSNRIKTFFDNPQRQQDSEKGVVYILTQTGTSLHGTDIYCLYSARKISAWEQAVSQQTA